MAKVIANVFVSGTDCYTDEGIENGHNHGDYGEYGYIPIGMYHRIKSKPENAFPFAVPGPGAPFQEAYKNLWIAPNYHYVDTLIGRSMEDLAGHISAVIAGVRSLGRVAPPTNTAYRQALISEIQDYGIDPSNRNLTGSQEMKCLQFDTLALEMLASRLTRSDVTIDDGDVINLIGHSRGAVTCIIASHDLYRLFPGVKVNIFAIDPVPGGGGNWTYEMTHLAPNVQNYVGVYAVDEVSAFFNGVVPWPSTLMMQNPRDPLAARPYWQRNPDGYLLFWAPGRHATVAGNMGEKGKGGIAKQSDKKGAAQTQVGWMVGTLAARCFQEWGAVIDLAGQNAMKKAWTTAKNIIHIQHKSLRGMRSYTYDVGISGDWNPLTMHWAERGVSSTSGKWNAYGWTYLEDCLCRGPLVKRKSWGSGLLVDYNSVQRRSANWLALHEQYYGDINQILGAFIV